MATIPTQNTTPAFIQPLQDVSDFLREYIDTCSTVVTAIPMDDTLTKEEFRKRYETLTREFRDRLINVANKESQICTLVSFVNAIDKARSKRKFISKEEDSLQTANNNNYDRYPVGKEAAIMTGFDTHSRTSPTDPSDSNIINEHRETVKDAASENNYNSCNAKILTENIPWLSIPFLAVERNDFEILDMCIKTGTDLETFRDLNGMTLLGYSVTKTKVNLDIIRVLLKCIGVNISTKDGETALITCIKNTGTSVEEKVRLLQILIEAGADVMIRSCFHGTALHGFISSLTSEMEVKKMAGWQSVIDILLAKGIDINAVDFYGQSALMVAIANVPPTGLEESEMYDSETSKQITDVRRCKKEIVEYLLHKGADQEVTDSSGGTSLYMALSSQNVDVLDTLIKHGANVNHQTNIKMSPAYHICCQSDWSEEDDINTILFPSLILLLRGGYDINMKGADDSTVLHFAAAKLNHIVCEFLVKYGAVIDARDYLQRSPLHMAARNPNCRVTETLIKLGSDIEAKDIHGDGPLTHACLHGNTKAVQILVDNGADCMACGDFGIQPIHMAAENGDALMVSILQNMGCDLCARDASGSTPLHYAASDGNHYTVEYLLNQNVNKVCEDYHGQLPLNLALLRGQYMASTLLAGSKSEVKFGKLPPGLFPNRPPRKTHQLDDYVTEIIQPLKTIGGPGAGIGKAILDTPGLGKLNLDEGECRSIFNSIQQLCLEIVERMGEIDPLFQCKLMNAGSSFEGVKVGYPDEFDFVCHLEKISAFVEKVEAVDTPEYSKIIMKDSMTPDLSRFCLRSNKVLNAWAILRHFYRLARIATYDVLKRPHQHIYTGIMLLNESEMLFRDSSIPIKKLQGFTVSWRGPTYKHIDISVDLNPVLYTTEWPSQAVQSCILLPNIQEEGIYLIPKFCDIIFALPMETVTVNSDLWRYSTHHVEATMLQRLPKEARDCYMLCKAFRMEPLTCSIQIDRSDDLMSDNYQNDDSNSDYNEEDYCDDDLNLSEEEENDGNNICDIVKTEEEEDEYNGNDEETEDEDRSETKNEFCFRSGNTGDTLIKVDEELERCEQDGAQCHGIIRIEQYDDVFKILIEDDHAGEVYDDHEDEKTAEQLIPSYHLKSIFLKEAEAILEQSKTFSDIELQTIPYRVYAQLKIAAETQYLTTLFFPDQNMYRKPKEDVTQTTFLKLRMSYINIILRLLRELGFGLED
ncbi:hypothetical protein ACJMK2_024814 [Sinanodonta woodiana]|uniref:Mab-21-like nucleotidyltransferase domain-containing protein n=1 Tax=Sinanodonta woodiana TaxID=1069815 RepID=A0ABD3XEM3_SINWO